MKTRGQEISEYAEAFGRDKSNMEAARILYEKLEYVFSHKEMSKEMKIRCVAEEIDNIVCGNMDAQNRGSAAKEASELIKETSEIIKELIALEEKELEVMTE